MIEFVRQVNWQERLYRYQWWLVGAVSLAAAGLCYAFVLAPDWDRYDEISATAAQHQSELEAAGSSYTAALESKRLWDRLTTQYGKEFLDGKTADSRDLVVLTFFNNVQDVATATGVTVEDINHAPSEGESAGDSSVVEEHVSLHVLGTYDRLSEFTKRLAASPHVTRVDQAVLNADDKGSGDTLQLDMKITLLFFVPQT